MSSAVERLQKIERKGEKNSERVAIYGNIEEHPVDLMFKNL